MAKLKVYADGGLISRRLPVNYFQRLRMKLDI